MRGRTAAAGAWNPASFHGVPAGVRAGRLDALPVLAVTPLVCLQFAMLLAVEYPDAAADATAGKRTLEVRPGAGRAAHLRVTVPLAAYAVLPPAAVLGLPLPVGLAAMVTAPLGGWRVWRLLHGAWRKPACWDGLATWSLTLLVCAATAELVASAWFGT